MPIVTKVGTNHPRVKEIQNCSYEGQPHIPRGDNCERIKYYENFQISSSPEPADQF
jgi:hypothetical protein